MTEQSTGVSRRRIIQGAAWAAPAIVVASAAPALAVSGQPGGIVKNLSGTATHTGSQHRLTAHVYVAYTAPDMTNDPVTAIRAIVDFPSNFPLLSFSGAGWSRDTSLDSSSGGRLYYGFQYTGTIDGKPDATYPSATTTLNATGGNSDNGNFSATVGASASGTTTLGQGVSAARSTLSVSS